MPWVKQEPVTIPLGSGPDQSTAELLRQATVLEANNNGVLDSAGELRKARGFTRYAMTTTTHGETPEVLFVTVGLDKGSLVVNGMRDVYGVVAPTASVDGAALVRRGRSMVGSYRVGVIHGSCISEE